VGSLLRELGSLYTNWRMMIKGIIGLTEEDFKSIPEDLLKKSCRRAPEIAQELIELRSKVSIERRIDYDEFIWSARAAAINALTALLARRKLAGSGQITQYGRFNLTLYFEEIRQQMGNEIFA